MSGPLFSYRHPFDVARPPTLEPEVKRAILASWASRSATTPRPNQLDAARGAAGEQRPARSAA